MDPGVRCHGMKANPIGYLWSKYECFLTTGCQDIDFYKTLTKWNRNGNGNAYDRGDYNSSFALRAVELKNRCHLFNVYMPGYIFVTVKDKQTSHPHADILP